MPELKTAEDIRKTLKADMSDIVDGDTELEGYDKGWRVGYNMGVIESFQKNKENAIKWIKYMKQYKKEHDFKFEPIICGCKKCEEILHTIDWIKYRFNINDEDL